MRHLFALCLALAACAADPVLLPDSGPCSSACGAGTVCQGGSCVAVDAGALDAGARCTPGTQGTCACLPGPMRAVFVCPASGVPPEPCPCSEDVDGAVRDVQVLDIPAVPHDQGIDTGPRDTGAADAGTVDVRSDVPGADGGVCPNGLTAFCDGRTVRLTTGERDGGISFFCGSCTNHCGEGEYCVSCRCGR